MTAEQLKPLEEAYQKFKHMDQPLCDSGEESEFGYFVAGYLWRAIKAAREPLQARSDDFLESHAERMGIRKAIQEAGHDLFESLSDIPSLQWLVGDLQGLNEDWAINHKETYGFDQLMKSGYSDNQLTWIKSLAKDIRESPLRPVNASEQLPPCPL